MTNRPTFPRSLVAASLFAMWSMALLLVVAHPEWLCSNSPSDGRIRLTIRIALACYFVAVARLLLPGQDVSLTRLVWTLGWATYLVHVTLAFHLAFGWSHADAVAHTQARSGFGEGIYASHLFTLIWTIDIGWGWLAPRGHEARPPWVHWTLHGFMAFMVFNGTVIYETGVIRWAGVGGFTVLGALIVWRASRGNPLGERRK